MILYNNNSFKISQVKGKPFKLEREIQSIFENNLEEVLSLQLVKSEYAIKDRRIDSLAFDQKATSLIIIERKRDNIYSIM
jgi:hypothetical protein